MAVGRQAVSSLGNWFGIPPGWQRRHQPLQPLPLRRRTPPQAPKRPIPLAGSAAVAPPPLPARSASRCHHHPEQASEQLRVLHQIVRLLQGIGWGRGL